MSDPTTLQAETTRVTGTRTSKRLRSAGQIPGIVYGLDAEPTIVAIGYSDLREAMSTIAGLNAVISLDVDGSVEQCIVKELQRHPVRDEVIHVDFLRVDPDQEVAVDVPINVIGVAKEVEQVSGMIDQTMFSLTVLAKPGSIPNDLEVDITNLTVGESARVADILLPEGVRTEIDPEDPVAVAVVTRSTIEAMAADEAADAEDGDGVAAAGAGAAEGGAAESGEG